MVSLWPFGKGNDADVSAFEKTLSTLTSKISKATQSRDKLISRARRVKALWTLYTSLAYMVFLLITVLVTGRQNWSAVEYSAVAGGPVIIFGVRSVIGYYYDYRISSQAVYLKDLHKQRDTAIEKFKNATKYNSTQAVLERYGAAPKSPPMKKDDEQGSSAARRRKTVTDAKPALQQNTRTTLPPPPTANIQRPSTSHGPFPNNPPSFQLQSPLPVTPNGRSPSQTRGGVSSQQADIATTAEFAPNALDIPPASPQYVSSPHGHRGAWYDRIMDVILGEDETKPMNRLALICSNCRLVNGQAPPGVRDLPEIGKWRCASCKAWNGEDNKNDVAELLATVKEQNAHEEGASEGLPSVKVANPSESEQEIDQTLEEEKPPAKSTRSQTKASET